MNWRRTFLSIGLAGLLLGGAVAIVPPLLWGDPADYSHVVSIQETLEYQATALLEKAWALPVAALYRRGIDFQRNLSFCGPASVVNLLRSRNQPGEQATILQGTHTTTVMGMVPGGLTLDELADIARMKLGGKVTVLRDLDAANFRQHLRRANDPSRRYVVNFARGPLFGAGGGHHSPIAAYLVDEDLVLVLDVNPKFGPWLVKSDRLYEAMNTLDSAAHKKRGMLMIE